MVSFVPSGGASGVVKLVSFGFRVLQFLIAIPIVAIYASQMREGYTSKGFRFNELIGDNNLQLGVAAAAIAIISSVVFAIMIVFLEFKWVCRACPWDLIIVILFAALFGNLKHKLSPGDPELLTALKELGVKEDRVHLMWDTLWIDLTSMLLWLITFLMGVGCLIFGRVRGSKPVY